MTAQTNISKLQKGFTLIELLVVLGILGILATALVATIDPFEQLKKASDANVKNAAVELAEGSLRYYTTHNAMPWHPAANGGVAGCGGAGTGGITPQSATNQSVAVSGHGLECVNGLISDGELKQEFTTATTITTKLYLIGAASDDATNPNSVKVCYQPQSKSQQRDVNTTYNYAGADQSAANTCNSDGGTTNCYWCAKL